MSEFDLTPAEAEAVITEAGCRLALILAAGCDGRIDADSDTQVRVWHLLFGDGPRGARLRAGDVLAAVVQHYQDSTERIMPAHVLDIVAEWREQWAASHPDLRVPMPVGGRVPRGALVPPPGRPALPPADPELLWRDGVPVRSDWRRP